MYGPDDPIQYEQALMPGLEQPPGGGDIPPGMQAFMSDVAPAAGWHQLAQQDGGMPAVPGLVADPQRVLELLTNEKIISQHASDVDESRAARQPRENEWRESADLYNNMGDSTGKAAWQ